MDPLTTFLNTGTVQRQLMYLKIKMTV